jgi:hypothetical protein
MDDLVRKYVAESCGRALSSLLDANDPSVWVISDVCLDLLVDVHAVKPDDVAAFWASRIAVSVAKAISRGDDGMRVLHFANRAAYLAHFLRDLADGCAWTKWYFREFDSLRSLPTGAAIREALLREPSQAEAALLELAASHRLAPVSAALSARDHERVIACCAGGTTHSTDALKAVLQSTMGVSSLAASSPLDLYLHIRRALPDLSRSDAAGAVQNASRIQRWARDNKLQTIVSLLLSGRMAISWVAPDEIGTLELLRGIGIQEPSWLATLPDVVRADRHPDEGVYEFESPLGAVFLLLSGLSHTAELLELFGSPEDGHLRYVLFLTCFARKSRDAGRDAALRVAAGLREAPDAAALSRLRLGEIPNCLEALALPEDVAYFNSYEGESLPDFVPDPDVRKRFAVAAAVLVRSFARRLPALGGSSVEYLWRNVLSGDSRIAVALGAITVRLKPRPLQIVLRMAGLHESQFEVPWLNDVRIRVRLDEA